jgi:hypothetical protein
MINSTSAMLKFFNPYSEVSIDIIDASSVSLFRVSYPLPLRLIMSKDLFRLL